MASIYLVNLVGQDHGQCNCSTQRQPDFTGARGSSLDSLHCCHQRLTQCNITLDSRSEEWFESVRGDYKEKEERDEEKGREKAVDNL